MDYSKDSYSYTEYDWYKNAKSNKETSSWSDPYYDATSGITMITTSFPFMNTSNQFAGVISADINLASIQELISSTHIGETGHAFLLSSDGTYLSDINTKDEIGTLSQAFNSMIANIKGLLTDVTQVSNEVAGSATTLAATSEEVSASSDEVARAVEKIARGSGEQARDAESGVGIALALDQKLERLKNNSNIMSDNASAANNANESGVIAVEDLIEKTDLNNESIGRAEQAVEALNVKSSNIGAILETITSIADQTNLLALNASIEAARAGGQAEDLLWLLMRLEN